MSQHIDPTPKETSLETLSSKIDTRIPSTINFIQISVEQNGSRRINLSSSCMFMLVISGFSAQTRAGVYIITKTAASSSTPGITIINEPSDAQFSIETDTTGLTITSSYSSASLIGMIIGFYGISRISIQ